MNRHWETLEFPTVLKRLAEHTDFSGGRELALSLAPAPDYREARERLARTREARNLLAARPDFALGGVRDIRPSVEQARRGVTLPPTELLAVRSTLRRAAYIHRTLMRLEAQFPTLADFAWRIQPQPALCEAIERVLDERGEIRDNASPTLSRIRRESRLTLERVRSRLRQLITSREVAPHLQDAIITRRDGRFVIPVRAEARGRVRGIVHDRSASGVTLFVEPEGVVELNNALRELQLAEEEEVTRLLAMLTAQIAYLADPINAALEALAELDLTLAMARYAEALEATEPELLPIPETPPPPKEGNLHPGTVVRLREARHPLLPADRVVPVDLVLDETTHILVITGPNTGGKTVTLKTMGLLTLMAQSGMHIPIAPGSALSFFHGVYVDIGDEQSIEQNLSTFSAHLTNILSFLPRVGHRDLVLLDELGAGTDPAEGSALAQAMLEAFRRRRVTAMVATHYPELKVYAHQTPGVRNASMEFDAETLAPTFHLTIGLPGRSNAFAIAQRLGMPEEIVREAQELLSGEQRRAEDMLTDLHRLRLQAARARDAALREQREAAQHAERLRRRVAEIERERAQILRRAREEAQAAVDALQAEVRSLRRQLQAVPRRDEARAMLETLAANAQALKVDIPTPEPLLEEEVLAAPPPAAAPVEGPIREGDTVRLRELGTQGIVTALDDNEATVQVGAMRLRVPLDKLELLHHGRPQEAEPSGVRLPPRAPSPGLQLDLRGETVEQALERLDRYLDDAVRAALPWVRIIHGKGSGRLRQEVQRFLNDHPLVTAYETAPPREGGAGATVVKLISA